MRFYPPPQPFIGGRQPLEPSKLPAALLVNEVVEPFIARGPLDSAVHAAITQQWHSRTVVLWQTGFTEEGAPTPDVPPVRGTRNVIQASIVQQWQEDIALAWQTGLVSSPEVNDPPIRGPLDLRNVYRDVEFYRSQRAPFYVPAAEVVVVDDVPRGRMGQEVALRSWDITEATRQRRVNYPIGIDQPPRTGPLGARHVGRQTWEQVDVARQRGVNYVPVVAAVVNDPPIRGPLDRATLMNIVQSWETLPFAKQPPVNYPQEGPAPEPSPVSQGLILMMCDMGRGMNM